MQRVRIGGFFAVRDYDDEDPSSFGLRQIQRKRTTRFVFYLFGAFGIAANLLQLVHNTAFLGAFWPFFAGIVFQLVTAMLQFARMILSPSE